LLFAGKGSLLLFPSKETIVRLLQEIIHQRRDKERDEIKLYQLLSVTKLVAGLP